MMGKIKTLTFVISFLFTFLSRADEQVAAHNAVMERPIVLVITSYNNSEWFQLNLDSVLSQNYTNYKIIYVDDMSPDGTGDLVEQYIQENNLGDRITLVKNEKRRLKVENFYRAVHEHCSGGDIVIDLDGDDFLAHENVLATINELYADSEVWLTYGSYVTWPKPAACCCREIPQEIIEKNAYRNYGWVASHLKSFYAWLFKRIKREDFLCEGKYLDMAGDLAFMFPMLEMSGGRFKFVSEVLYLYNRANPINDDKQDLGRQRFLDTFLRNRPPYEALSGLPDEF